ncbi:MAG: D-alanyl-D-alanine carboxypeptidase family protein [Alphaproteobacteria bacterium]
MANNAAALARAASLVMDADSGKVIDAVNPDVRNYPASLTKMMTLYLLFDALKSGRMTENQRLTASAHAVGMPPSKLGLKAGDTITVREAMLALITKSANDAAVVLAEAMGGTEANFARQMTERAHRLGMRRTTFRNASGLPNNGQMSTARDMATLAQHLIKDFPKYYKNFSTAEFTYDGRVFRNHNALLENYPGADGLKTGYIRASGYNLVSSAERDGRRLIGVVFGGQSPRNRDRQMIALLDRGFATRPGKAAPLIAVTEPEEAVVPASAVAAVAASEGEAAMADGRWAIQVGAFSRAANAKDAAHAASARLGGAAKDTLIAVVPSTSAKTRLYRARLTGMSEDAARQACRTLKSKRVDCLPIAPGSEPLAEGSN